MAESIRRPERQTDKVEAPARKSKEWDGQGSRYHAVKRGDVKPELVYNGLTTVPVQAEAKTDEHTGRYVAVSDLETDRDADVSKPRDTGIRSGEVVEGLSDEQLRSLVASGAVRLETKDEAREANGS